MKQIYDFEQRTPPVLNEQMLRAELERRKLADSDRRRSSGRLSLNDSRCPAGVLSNRLVPCTLSAMLWIYHDCGNRRWCHRHRLFS